MNVRPRPPTNPRVTHHPAARPSRAGGFVVLLGLLLASALAFACLVVWWYAQLPSLDRATNYQPQSALQVFTSDGVEIGQFGAERRTFVRHDDVPKLLREAVVAVEDVRFYEHGGVDARGIARALFSNITRGRHEGASTITQQVARNVFLSHDRTLERKLKEAMLALKLEHALSKDQILELYLNQIYLGQRSYGFAAAAQTYFGKKISDLTLGEIALLAGLPKNPGYANPVTNMERALARQRVVLARLQDVGLITAEQRAKATAEKLAVRSALEIPVHAEYVAEMARQAVFERFGDEAYRQGYKVYTSIIAPEQQAAHLAVRRGILAHERRRPYKGPEAQEDLGAADDEQTAALLLKDYIDDEDLRAAIVLSSSPKEVRALLASGETVVLNGEGLRWAQASLAAPASDTTGIRRGSIIRVVKLDPPTPKGGNAKAAHNSPAHGAGGAASWTISQWPEVQSALVALTPQTGRVRALVGGFDFTANQFNRVTKGWRQPGSSFKPFLYSAALERGVTPTTVVNDAPLDLEGSDWDPKNSDGTFDGPMTVRQALAKSKNLVSIRLLQKIGTGTAIAWAGRFGFDTSKLPDNLTFALGTGSVTPMQMASAYGVFATGGYLVSPIVIERITDSKGTNLYAAPAPKPLAELERVIPEANAFITDSLLQEVTRSGTAARARAALGRQDLYGKTGTTNDSVDAWFAGFQPGVVAVVWTGYDKPQSLGANESGGGLSLPIWVDYMRVALKKQPPMEPTPPDDVERVNGDWRFVTEPASGWVRSIGVPEAPPSDAAQEADGTQDPGTASGLPTAPPPLPPAPARPVVIDPRQNERP